MLTPDSLTPFLFKKLFLNWKGNQTLTLIASFATLGFVLGVCALISVMSIMQGFEHQLTSQLHHISPNVILTYPHRPSAQVLAQVRAQLKPQQQITLTTPLKGFLNNEVLGENVLDVILMDSALFEKLRSFLKNPPSQPSVLMGSEAAQRLFLPPGSQTKLLLPSLSEDPLGLVPKTLEISVHDTVKTGVYRIDEYSIFLPETVLGIADIPSHYYHELHLSGRFTPEDTQHIATLTHASSVKTWEEQNHLLLLALWLEQTSMSVFLCLIIMVALSSIIALLTIFFTDRKKTLGLLLCLGCSEKNLKRMMTQFGLTIGALGSLLGIAAAAGVLAYVTWSKTFQLPHIYYQRNFPVHIDPWFIAGVVGASLLACYGVSRWIAYRVFRQPLLKHFGEDPVL